MADAGRLQRAWRIVSRPQHLKRTTTIALLVGGWLTAFNQGPMLLVGQMTTTMAVQILLNLLTPFVVANLGLLSGQTVTPPAAADGKPGEA